MPGKISLIGVPCLVGMIFFGAASGQTAAVRRGIAPVSASNSVRGGSRVPFAPSPDVIRYSGILKDLASPAQIALTFSIYKDRRTSQAAWQETQKVRLDAAGRYTVLLGAATPGGMPASVFTSAQAQWLGIRIAGQVKEQRFLLANDAYAASTIPAPLGASPQPPSPTSGPVGRPGIRGMIQLPITSAPDQTAALSAGAIIGNNQTEILLIQQDGNGYGLHAVADSNSAILAETASQTAGNNTIHSINHSPQGTAVLGEATQTTGDTFGLRGISASNTGVGVLGADPSATGTTTGVRGESSSPDGTAGVFDSLGGGNILSGRSAGVERFRVDSQGNVISTAFSGDGSKLTNVNASFLGGFSAADFLTADALNSANINATQLEGLRASDFIRVGAPQNLSGLESLVSKQLAINADPAVGSAFGSAAFMREDQDSGHLSGFQQAGPQTHFRLTRAYCDKTSASQQSASDQDNFFCVPDAVTIDDAHPASSTPSRDFIIAPYKFGMGIFYPGLIEVASDEFSVHVGHNNVRGAHLWVGDEHDLGGVLTTAHDVMNPDNTIDRSQSFVSMTSQTFTGASHGDMLFSVRDPQDNFRFQFGPANAAEAPGTYQQYTRARIDSTGKGFFDGGTQTGGADFAESVSAAGGNTRYEPGDVLVIDTNSDRQFALAGTPYSTLVAGIYSTKPGVVATVHASEDPRLGGEIPMAVVGIVPCKVTDENGPIARGDLLVTSSTPGYAMRGTEKGLLPGAIVGKALQPFSGKKGKIEVLVTLR